MTRLTFDPALPWAAVAALAAILLVPTELGLNPHATDMLFIYAFAVAVGRRLVVDIGG